MGEYAELALEQELDEIFNRGYHRSRAFWIHRRYEHSDNWMTLDGRVLKLTEMEANHISNCIAMLERADHDYSDCPVLHNMKAELQRRYQSQDIERF